MRNKKLILVGLLILGITASSFIYSAQKVSAKEVSDLKILKGQALVIPKKGITMDDYITNKKSILNTHNDPSTKIAATISFSKWTSIDEVQQLIDSTGIEPVSILYTFRGKDLGHGETNILPNTNIKVLWNGILQARMDQFQSELKQQKGFTNAPDSEEKLATLKEQAQKKIIQIQNSTPIIYAIRVQASPDLLLQIQSNDLIRLIDTLDQNTIQQLKSNNIPESKVILPAIIPDDKDLFTGVPNEVQ